MKIDRILMEGRCVCGQEIEVDRSPIHILPQIVEEKIQCKGCGIKFHIHVQEIKLYIPPT